MTPTFFATPADFRKWLQQHHEKEQELLVGFYKKGTGKPSITWDESVNEALCFGWIDGVRKSIDGESYTIRFTPRKASSIWSAINIRKMKELTDQGKMTAAGLAAFAKRKEDKSAIYTYEREHHQLTEAFENEFKKNTQAWEWFQTQAAGYRKQAADWVMRAKKEETKLKRLETLIKDCEEGRKIKPLSY